jgi:hypothetical protein
MSDALSNRTTEAGETSARPTAAEHADPKATAARCAAGADGSIGTTHRSAEAGETVRPAILSYEDFRIRPHNCFACGELNEIGLHLNLNLEPERCWTELVMPRRFEGWEGIIHGGIL